MQAVINVALPVFAIMALGYAAGRIGILGEASSDALNRYVYWIALPPLLFRAMATSPIDQSFPTAFVGAFLGGTLGVWALAAVIGFIVHRGSPAVLTMQGMNASFSNTGYLGIPLLVAAFGERGLAPASLATVIMSAVSVGIAVTSLELANGQRRGLRHAFADVIKALLRNPLVVAPLIGIGWSALALSIPTPVDTTLQLVGASASPCALFAIGLFLSGQSMTAGLGEVGWITALKLLWQPLITWVLAMTIFPMEPFWVASAVILAALPTGALVFVIAKTYDVYVDRTSSAIIVSTVISVITVSALIAIYAPIHGVPTGAQMGFQ